MTAFFDRAWRFSAMTATVLAVSSLAVVMLEMGGGFEVLPLTMLIALPSTTTMAALLYERDRETREGMIWGSGCLLMIIVFSGIVAWSLDPVIQAFR